VIVAGNSADPYGWKALRGSMGSAFRLPIVREPDVEGVLAALRAAGVRVLATATAAAATAAAAAAAANGGGSGGGGAGGVGVTSRRSFSDKPLTGACAFLLGGEGPGLSETIISAADGVITIPMEPPVESLNVAVSAGLIIYEARRQRLG
jgi:TrmH family RNA methyltransferase